MLKSLTVLFVLSLSLYWYTTEGMSCTAPLSYQVVALDERFNLTSAEAQAVMAEAEGIWEEAVGRELFSSTDGNPDIAVSFIFDDRQERAIAEESLRDSLSAKEATTEDLNAAYENTVGDYHAKKATYEAKVGAYEDRLSRYNEVVERYNEAGGAPPKAYAELEEREALLQAEAASLEQEGQDLAALADKVNKLSEAGNDIIRQYNAGVHQYNRQFGEPDEFTQGDYQDGQIHIYTFTSRDELITVMAHELGHALDIDHVEGNASIMYYLMGDQPTPPVLSATDLSAFLTVCGENDSLATRVRTLINKYLL